MATSDTLIDTVFDGRYRIIRRIGSGGMADVYLAEDEELGRRVAIKILNDRYATDDLFIERFRREAQSAAGLTHPNIVSIYDRGEAQGTYYIAMEVIEGTSLKEMIITRGRLPARQAIDFTRQILAALRFAHRNGIIHRDIKPHNILIGLEEQLKVTDFGIARAGALSQMTEAGSMLGTAQYLSPEQARGAPVTAASDLYAVGIVLYEMLTGKVPFGGDSPVEIAMKHINETPSAPSAGAPRVPAELDQVVLRAVAKNPIDRYQSAEDFDDDLVRAAKGLPVARQTKDAATAILSEVETTRVSDGTAEAGAAPAGRGGSGRGGSGRGGSGRSAPPPARSAPPPARTRRLPPIVYDPYRDRERRPSGLIPVLIVFVLLAIAAVAGWYIFNEIREKVPEPTSVTVPLVEGLTEENAVARLTNQDLRGVVDREPSSTVERGKVIGQDPPEGTAVEPGSQVTIIVSAGIQFVNVPRVINLTEDDARFELSKGGLDVEVNEGFSQRDPGLVFRQSPQAGEEIRAGSTVTIWVSRGPQTGIVPDVLGFTITDALLTLREAGFEPTIENIESEQPIDTVVAQSPGPGTDVQQGALITLFVSTGPPEPETVTVPGVVGSLRDQAIAVLTEAGFNVSIIESLETDPAVLGTVLDQRPDGGVRAEKGATVTITVVAEPQPELEPVPVPNVINLDQPAAEALLEAAGLQVVTDTTEVTDPAFDGFVIEQSPAELTEVEPGTPVTITIGVAPSAGPPQQQPGLVPVPNVINLDQPTAEAILVAEGFPVLLTTAEVTDPAFDGFVIEQSPAELTEVEPGTPVTITIAVAAPAEAPPPEPAEPGE
ncbi:MAG: Stk1 family PASTA domain-containing Ser/Thr kinase [Actinomycetia bacterium]|nr:Stk1 family PASTA domain-containing Ser/Thr kinase [Actinomycetes bacterium]